MSNHLHVANAFFEWELDTQNEGELSQALHVHRIYQQLQFLPVLYASKHDRFLVTALPPASYWEGVRQLGIDPPIPVVVSDRSIQCDRIESWGYSRIIAHWAAKRNLHYPMPDWETVRHANSKAFSFESSPKLPSAMLLSDESEVRRWLRSFPGKKVLKTIFGLSGRGHFIVDDTAREDQLSLFLRKELERGRPLLCEPWVDRVLDFSTQWMIDAEGAILYVGSTLCENDGRGQYQANRVGDEKALFGSSLCFLHVHKTAVLPLLQKIAALGYFGNVGIDAMLYKENQSSTPILHPVVEINARKTMGWAALAFQRRYYPHHIVTFRFGSAAEGLLPSHTFKRNISIEAIAINPKSR